tara:strand:+ start:538 stop:702 length:165 start_codon:yes stop_codon:yes gene_type:complete
MLLRNQEGILIEINRKDFINDKDYYTTIFKTVTGKNIINKKPNIVNILVEKAIR